MAFRMKTTALLAGLLLVGSASALSADVVSLLTDEQKQGGYLIPIVQEAWRKEGYAADIRFMPWKRALATALASESTGVLGVYYSGERAERLHYSDPIGKTELVFFQRKGRGLKYRTLQDLKPYRIGVVNGGAYTPEFDRAGYLDKQAISNVELQIDMLLAGRLDLIVDQKDVIYQLLHEKHPEQIDDIEALRPALSINHYYVALPKTDPDAAHKIAALNRGLKALREDGSLFAIQARHSHP